MKSFFPKFSQTHVFIKTDDKGGGFNCRMLPISALDEMRACSDALSAAKTIEEVASVQDRLRALAETVIPDEFKDNLKRFDIPTLTELVAYLMYGDDDDAPKKN